VSWLGVETWLLLVDVLFFLNYIIYWSILIEICFNWSDNYCLFLLLVNSYPLPVSLPLYIFIDPFDGYLLLDPNDEVWVFEIPFVFTAFLFMFSLDVKLPRLNSNDLSSYLLLLVDTFDPELG